MAGLRRAIGARPDDASAIAVPIDGPALVPEGVGRPGLVGSADDRAPSTRAATGRIAWSS
jgi:hypothetical protein